MDKLAGGYDTMYTSFLNCVDRDNNNRVYANDDMILDKNSYKVGEKVVVKGINNISGMQVAYTYKMHIFNPSDSSWIVDSSDYRGKVSFTLVKRVPM